MKIAVDFDGTCVTHEFPKIGKDIGAVSVLKELVKRGHQLILYTMRSDKEDVSTKEYDIDNTSGKYLTDAIQWFQENNIDLYSIQKDIGQENWTSSNKCYAQLYIDDAALGCPLKSTKLSSRPYVDWVKIDKFLKQLNII